MAEKFQPLSVSKLDNNYDVIVIGSVEQVFLQQFKQTNWE